MKKQRTILLQSLIITSLSFATFTAPAQQIANGTLLYRPATSYMLDEDGKLVPSNVLRISKSDYVNSFNVGFYGLPESLVGAKSVLANVEFERFVSNRASVAVRAVYINYAYDEDEPGYRETGSGTGAGIGFSYRKYFNEYGGFFLSPAVEFAIVNWDYNYLGKTSFDTESGTGTSFAVAPNFSLGYRINIGDYFALTPSLMAGYRIGIGIEHEGEAVEESGPLGAVGASVSVRF